MTEEHLCVVCPQLRAGEPRIYERRMVCEGCRSRLRSMLAEVAELYADLSLEKGSAGGAKISGSRTPPLPLAVSALDLTLTPHRSGVSDDLVPLFERRETTVKVYDRTVPRQRCGCDACEQTRAQAVKDGRPDPTRPYVMAHEAPLVEVTLSERQRKRDANGWLAYGPSGDQVGDVSAPALLDSWARDWQTYEWALLPPPTVDSLTGWLTDRLEDACDRHPAIDDFAAELNELLRRLRPHGPRAELKIGVPCRECEAVTLFRWPGSDYIECGSCTLLMTPEEYERWIQLIAATEHQPWVRAVVARQRDTAAS